MTKSQYMELAKKMVDFIEKKHKLPNYLRWGNFKISQRLYTYTFARVLVYYSEHKKWDDKIIVNEGIFTKTKNKKYGHATKHGCDNMGQNTGYYCGCHSLQEVFRNLTGIVVPQKTIAGWAGTTTSGTSHSGLDTAVAYFNQKYKQNLKVEWKHQSDLGWSGIEKIIKSSNQDAVIHNLYRNQWGHYETVNAIQGEYIKVQNSLGDMCGGGCYCGYVESRLKSVFKQYIGGISQKSVMVVTRQ